MATDFTSISSARKRAIRAEMLRRFKQSMRKTGAMRAAGGDVSKMGKKSASMKGYAWESPLERQYATTLRGLQKGTDTKKAVAKTARAVGAANPNLVTAQKMKSVSKGGTVSRGSYADKKTEAAAWRRKHRAAAGTDATKLAKIESRYRFMRGLPKK